MENALWKDKPLLASVIADDYALEKEIRKASGRKELRCPDPDCQFPIVRYCHGEIKDAFFAHLNNELCDYAKFDSENTQVMRSIRKKIYENFKARGFQVQTEIKLLRHHYSHLIFDFSDGLRIAVEIGTQRLSANRIDSLTEQYKEIGVPVKWIVLGDTDMPVRENQTYFVKRYALNESANRDLMVVDWNCQTAAQYKMDTETYEYHGNSISVSGFDDVYTEFGTLDDLTFESGEITFTGFHERYEKWLEDKRSAFNLMIHKAEQEKQKQMQEKVEQERRLEELKKKQVELPPYIRPIDYTSTSPKHDASSLSYEERRQEILGQIDRQDMPVRDSTGARWVKCRQCGAVETDNKFGSYGGGGKDMNSGICYNCSGRGHR